LHALCKHHELTAKMGSNFTAPKIAPKFLFSN
jgi:hypothetical protein